MGRNYNINMPSLLGTSEFTPTVVMQKFAIAYPQMLDKSPTQILKILGHSECLWYQWNKKPNFPAWLQQTVSEFMTTAGLAQVYRAIHREAVKHSAQDRKLYLERFDISYKPASAIDINPAAGRRPPDAAEARKRSQERIAAINREQDKQTRKSVEPEVLEQ